MLSVAIKDATTLRWQHRGCFGWLFMSKLNNYMGFVKILIKNTLLADGWNLRFLNCSMYSLWCSLSKTLTSSVYRTASKYSSSFALLAQFPSLYHHQRLPNCAIQFISIDDWIGSITCSWIYFHIRNAVLCATLCSIIWRLIDSYLMQNLL